MDPGKLTTILQTSGGWGLAAVLMVVIWYLARVLLRMTQQQKKETEEQNQKLFEMMEKRIATDIEHKESFKQLRETIKELIPLLRRT